MFFPWRAAKRRARLGVKGSAEVWGGMEEVIDVAVELSLGIALPLRSNDWEALGPAPWRKSETGARSPSTSWGEGSPTNIDYSKKGTLILTSTAGPRGGRGRKNDLLVVAS